MTEVTARKIDELLNLEADPLLITSFFMSVDGAAFPRKEYREAADRLLKEHAKQTEGNELTREQRRSLEIDRDRIRNFVELEFERGAIRGLGLFSCGGKDFWQVYEFARPVEDKVTAAPEPYIRPLSALLDNHPKYCLLLVDRSKARIFEVTQGEIVERSEVLTEVPARVREGGWYGLEEKRIERHIDDHVHRHWKQVAETTFDFFRRYDFDWLIVGGHDQEIREFEAHLHPYLQERVVGTLRAGPETPFADVFEASLIVQRMAESDAEEKAVRRLVDATSQGWGVAGLAPTLDALQAGQVQTLVLSEGLVSPGKRCPNCGLLQASAEVCPICDRPLVAVPDVLEKAVELAFRQRCRIEHIQSSTPVQPAEGVGAILRARP